MGQECCFGCVGEYIKSRQAPDKAKKVAKRVERERTKKKKDEVSRLSDLANAAQEPINDYVRWRDRHQPCISCGKPAWSDVEWHASHYRSRGGCSGARFLVWNIHKACLQCNWQKSGNIAEYGPQLLAKIGEERMNAVTGAPKSKRYTREYLIRLREVARKFLAHRKRLAKKLGTT